jgi:Zn-dependent protease
MQLGLFIETINTAPLFFISVVITVVVSIVLHELSHGVAAIWQGDRTPIERGHMTLNPLVHMGWMSLILLAVAGIAWGLMPVNPYRFRSRYGDALVAAAGPLCNVLLAILALTALGLWWRFYAGTAAISSDASTFAGRIQYFLLVFGQVNLVLCLFNLIPIPPLDGSRIAANFNRTYAGWLANPQSQGIMIVLFVVVFLGGEYLFIAADQVAGWYIHQLLTLI